MAGEKSSITWYYRGLLAYVMLNIIVSDYARIVNFSVYARIVKLYQFTLDAD